MIRAKWPYLTLDGYRDPAKTEKCIFLKRCFKVHIIVGSLSYTVMCMNGGNWTKDQPQAAASCLLSLNTAQQVLKQCHFGQRDLCAVACPRVPAWVSSHRPQKCTLREPVCQTRPSVSACGCAWPSDGQKGAPSRVGPFCLLGCRERVRSPTLELNWSKQVGKEFYLSSWIFPKWMYNSHWFQCLILGAFWEIIWKFGGVSVTMNEL